jgi:predicted RNase H-like nuclease (RuvC/YqgF family)
MGTVQAIASIAERDPSAFDAFREQAGVPTDQPVIGWFSMVEAYERRVEDLDNPVSAAADPRLAVDELRQLVCVDVDERIFDVIRRRSTGRQTSGGGALPRYRREFAADVEAAGGIPEGVRASGEGLPLMVDALLRLTRVTRAETELRAALAEAGQ